MGSVLAFTSEDVCTACGRPTSTHRIGREWVGCARDVVIGQDQVRVERHLRLQLLQMRVLKVKPFGIGDE